MAVDLSIFDVKYFRCPYYDYDYWTASTASMFIGSLVGIPVIGVISFVIPILKISLIPDTGHQAEKSRMVLGMLGAGIVLWERHREQNRVII